MINQLAGANELVFDPMLNGHMTHHVFTVQILTGKQITIDIKLEKI